MSYARFGADSDVYVYLSVHGDFQCCACQLKGSSQSFTTTDAIIAHLRDHIDAGYEVPTRTIARLEAEREENDAWIATGAPFDA